MSEIDVRDLKSVRRAAVEETSASSDSKSYFSFRQIGRSPLALKVVALNLFGIILVIVEINFGGGSVSLSGGFIALCVSLGLSILFAVHIIRPLIDLSERVKRNPINSGDRISIPDLSARNDEIGRLSNGLAVMMGALYDHLEANEQFAADVAHEIKNPLASLRSAVGTMRLATREDQREELLRVIEHDVIRMDRLVSDIANASRLDSELVKERQEKFDICKTVHNLSEYLGAQAKAQDIEFVYDLPKEPVEIIGLEGRLAQVFVNLITNATSFCTPGDAVRLWLRVRDGRALVVVEDTGPGIPKEALHKIFQRFYSERPVQQFGNNSGLGLAISKQIVEAHGGRIWAENIEPTAVDYDSEPLGARFVVDLPL